MDTTSTPLLGGRYQLDAVLRRGGMATVWSGTDIRLGRPVAIKVVTGAASADPLMLRSLHEEARTLARLAHTNIVTVHDLGSENDTPYVVMELVEGDDLRRRLEPGPLITTEAIRIAIQICNALQAAHEAGIVHRDIKPDNVLLTRSGEVKVCDFGIARLQQANQTRATAEVTTIGTAMYMAPEQATDGKVDPRTDLYALGCVLYEMLTGEPPFTGGDPLQVLWQHVHDEPLPVAARRGDVTPGLAQLVERLLAKSPQDRPARAADVRVALQRLPADTVAAPVPVTNTTTQRLSRGRAAVIARTQVVPRLPAEGDYRPSSTFRIGPAGILAVAGGTALITALVIAVTMLAARPSQQTVQQPPGSTSSATATPTPTASPAGSVDDVRSVIQTQADLGELDEDSVHDLLNRLDDIENQLADGDTDKAVRTINRLREQIDELSNDDKITESGRTAILESLDRLADSLDRTGDGNN